jgi:hypothetical protein
MAEVNPLLPGSAERTASMTAFRFISPRSSVIAGAVLLAAVTRLIPHPPNFAPITAMALFGAATLTDKRAALLIPLLALFVSDLCIEAMHRMGLMAAWGIYSGMWVTYTAFLLITVMGFLLRHHRSVPTIAAATFAGSVVFFVVSNFGVWVWWNMYPHTLEGLLTCYTAAIPFFRNTLLGDAVYSTVLFGGFAAAERLMPILRELPSVPTLQEAQG